MAAGAGARAIALTELEQRVFGALLGAVHHFGLGCVVRAAGGWVRDKLLGKSSDDIDIVVDDMSGEDFALRVADYMSQSAAADVVSGVGVVKQNPDQSKHLATACFSLYGLSLDVNSLRKETYTQDSRIPVTSTGTPLEDAQRRDFTVNALFYNLSTGAVEDFTCSGLSDLEEGVMRTPLPPSDSFRDDPLRMLRALRFAARLDFRLDAAVLQAARDSSTHRLLEAKVSRERFGIEVDKMMKAAGMRPASALVLMHQAGLLGTVFISPEITAALPPEQAPLGTKDLATGVQHAQEVAELLLAEEPQRELRIAMYAAVLSPWAGWTCLDRSKRKPLIPSLLRAALKIDTLACEAAFDVASAATAFDSGRALVGPERNCRVGASLRTAGEQWPQALALSEALGGVRGDAAREGYLRYRQWIADSGLLGCWHWKPLIDGKRLMQPPFSVPKGRRVGEAMELQLQWRLERPGLTEEECASRIHELVKSWQKL